MEKLGKILQQYKEWIVEHPNQLENIESGVKLLSYSMASRLGSGSSHILPELVYCSANLVTLYNDIIMEKCRLMRPPPPLEVALTIINLAEVLVEIIAREKCTPRTKWAAITAIQLVKCAMNIRLILKHKSVPIRCPPAPARHSPPPNEDLLRAEDDFALTRSGRHIKRLDVGSYTVYIPESNSEQIRAEMLYVLKPIMHLILMRVFGQKSWPQFMVPLFMDLISLRIHEKNIRQFSYQEKIELNRRRLRLLMYLMRSPIFEKFTEKKLKGILSSASKLPLIGNVPKVCLETLPMVQNTYFYMWDQ